VLFDLSVSTAAQRQKTALPGFVLGLQERRQMKNQGIIVLLTEQTIGESIFG
jgi:hypothetical protein